MHLSLLLLTRLASAAPCTLPATPPADLAIRVQRVTVPRGGLPRTEQLVLKESCTPQEDSDHCQPITADALGALYKHIRAEGFADLGQEDGGTASPHYGARFITISWAGAPQCDVSDSSTRTLPVGERAIFDALFARIVAEGD